MKLRDNQRSKLYAWERELEARCYASGAPAKPLEPLMTLAECAALVRIACRAFKLRKMPRVTDGRARRRACGSPERVCLPRWSRTPHTVLHEAAHAITRYRIPKCAGHGREFCGMYAELLARYCGYDRNALLTSMREYGLYAIEAERIV